MINADYMEAHRLFAYDPESGFLVRKYADGASHRHNHFAGKMAGWFDKIGGRIVLSFQGGKTYAHRVIWLMMTGSWPRDHVDHRDGNGTNNRWINLRDVPAQGNQQNRVANKNRGSGICGVQWDDERKKWVARITHKRKTIHLGRFDTPEEARQAYLRAKERLHTYQPVPRDAVS